LIRITIKPSYPDKGIPWIIPRPPDDSGTPIIDQWATPEYGLFNLHNFLNIRRTS
jgi:hypothetical protein